MPGHLNYFLRILNNIYFNFRLEVTGLFIMVIKNVDKGDDGNN